eukprot:7381353-Prymnesium_polylepis.2
MEPEKLTGLARERPASLCGVKRTARGGHPRLLRWGSTAGLARVRQQGGCFEDRGTLTTFSDGVLVFEKYECGPGTGLPPPACLRERAPASSRAISTAGGA